MGSENRFFLLLRDWEADLLETWARPTRLQLLLDICRSQDVFFPQLLGSGGNPQKHCLGKVGLEGFQGFSTKHSGEKTRDIVQVI